MKTLSISLMLVGAIPTPSPAKIRPADIPHQIYGTVQIVDATTFEFVTSRQIVRLAGYEAPRLDQTATSGGVEWPAGQVSRAWMILRTLGQNINCGPIGRDANQMLIAHCFVGETNLAATAIAEGIGYAFTYPGEPQVPAYFDIERKARGLGFGVWSSPTLLPPWLYDALVVKGSTSGSRISGSDAGLPLPPPVNQRKH
jgi:endonuclease YncB( thermonuclease family)